MPKGKNKKRLEIEAREKQRLDKQNRKEQEKLSKVPRTTRSRLKALHKCMEEMQLSDTENDIEWPECMVGAYWICSEKCDTWFHSKCMDV